VLKCVLHETRQASSGQHLGGVQELAINGLRALSVSLSVSIQHSFEGWPDEWQQTPAIEVPLAVRRRIITTDDFCSLASSALLLSNRLFLSFSLHPISPSTYTSPQQTPPPSKAATF